MFVPSFTRRSPKGGGGHSAGHSKSSSESSKSTSSIGISGTKRTASTSSKGGGKATTIAEGQPFSGRTIGGGTRDEIYGTQTYGSGYPHINSTVPISDRDFPFGFLPLVFLTIAAAEADEYALAIEEYGYPWGLTRFGGPLGLATFYSQLVPGMSYQLYADNSSVAAITSEIKSNCSSYLNTILSNSAIALIPTNASASSTPDPGSVVQYFRSSSAALLLSSYNNTAAYTNGTDTPLPDGIDTGLLSCLNSTIAAAIPITDLPPRLTEGQRDGIIVGAVFGAIFLALAVFFCYVAEILCCRCCERRNRRPVITFWKSKEDGESSIGLKEARTPTPTRDGFPSLSEYASQGKL